MGKRGVHSFKGGFYLKGVFIVFFGFLPGRSFKGVGGYFSMDVYSSFYGKEIYLFHRSQVKWVVTLFMYISDPTFL